MAKALEGTLQIVRPTTSAAVTRPPQPNPLIQRVTPQPVVEEKYGFETKTSSKKKREVVLKKTPLNYVSIPFLE